jgi:hypothetical protein
MTTPMTVRSACGLLCALLCVGCVPGEEAWSSSATEYPLAYFHDDCAPWDGPALSIVLTHAELDSSFEESFPSVRVTSYRPPSTLAGSSFEWTGDAPDLGYASWCEFFDSCWSATTVRVRFDRAQPSADELAGQVHLVFEGGRLVSGAFKAVRLPLQAFCG